MNKRAKAGINRWLDRRHLQITTTDRDYFHAAETVAAAKREGLSVCDYVEKISDQQGDTQHVIDEMTAAGVFQTPDPAILEIGTGTGRYLEKTLAVCTPSRYESYEVLRDWAEWLQSTYPVISRDADGSSLKQTASNSVDMLHAHGVFVYLPFLVSFRYWVEIWRVTKSGGHVVFDIFSEDCMDEPTVHNWLKDPDRVYPPDYPCLLPRDYVVSVFEGHGFRLTHSFESRVRPGRSRYLVFVRDNTG